MDIDFQPASSAPIDFQPVNASGHPTEPFSGTHFTDADISDGVLQGARRGSSGSGVESHRVHRGKGAPPGVHFVRDGHIAHPSLSGRKNAYHVQKNVALADLDNEPIFHKALLDHFSQLAAEGVPHQEAHLLALNHAEGAVREAGFDGYHSPRHAPGHVMLFGDHQAAPTKAVEHKNASGERIIP